MKKYGNIALQLVENLPRLENSVKFLESFEEKGTFVQKNDATIPEERQNFSENEHDAIQKMCFSSKGESKKQLEISKRRIKCIRFALQQLTEAERAVVEIKIRTQSTNDFIFEVYEKFNVDRSAAYRRLNIAKNKLATALFGEIDGARRR